MPLKKVFISPKELFTVHLKNGSVVNTNVAKFHYLFEQTSGYVGHHIKIKPPPLHNFSYYRDDIDCREDYSRRYNDGSGSDFGAGSCLNTTPHSVVFYPPVDFTNVYNRAVDKLNDEVRGNLDLSVDAAEYHQTLRTLRATDRVWDYTNTFFKRRFGAVKALADLRLEYMYGVKPLLMDVYDSADESVRVVINKAQRFKVRATDKGYKVDQFEIYCYWGLQKFPAKDLRLKVACELGVDIWTDQFDLSRWTSLNPVSIAWELTPYSFVADWFINVGGYLRNLETYCLNSGKFRSGYRSDLVVFESKKDGVYNFPIPSGSTGSDVISANVRGSRFTRTVLTDYPAPYLPRLQAHLGSVRLLNAAALLAQFLKFPFKTRAELFGKPSQPQRYPLRIRTFGGKL